MLTILSRFYFFFIFEISYENMRAFLQLSRKESWDGKQMVLERILCKVKQVENIMGMPLCLYII